jgi:hypothetical protein
MLPTDSSLYTPFNNTPSVSTEVLKQQALAYELEPQPLALTVQPPDTFTVQAVNSSPMVTTTKQSTKKAKSKPTKETEPTSGIPLWGKLTLGMASVVIIGFLVDHFSGGNVLKVIRRPFEKTEPKSKPDPIEPKPDPTNPKPNNPIPPILPPNHEPVIPDPVIEELELESVEKLQTEVNSITQLEKETDKETEIKALQLHATKLSTQLAEKQLVIVKKLHFILSEFVNDAWHESHRFLDSNQRLKANQFAVLSNPQLLNLHPFIDKTLQPVLYKETLSAEKRLTKLKSLFEGSQLFQRDFVPLDFDFYVPKEEEDKEILAPWFAYRFKLKAEMGYIKLLLQTISLDLSDQSSIRALEQSIEHYQMARVDSNHTFFDIDPYSSWAKEEKPLPLIKQAKQLKNQLFKQKRTLEDRWNDYPENTLWKEEDAQELRGHLERLFSPSIEGGTQIYSSNTLEQKIRDLEDRLLPPIKSLIQQRQECKEVQEKLKQKLANLSQN